MKKEIKNNLAILSYHEKRIQLEQEVRQRFENLGEDAQAVVRDVIREFIRRSAMPVRIIYGQKHVEEMANDLAKTSQKFQELLETHERTVSKHNDQLNSTWQSGYDAGAHHASEAVKHHAAKDKITLLVNKPVAVESEKIQQLRLQLSTRESELDQQTLELSEAKQKLLDQAKRHQQRVDELKAEIAQKPEPIMAELGSFTNTGLVVGNWRNSWKWISNWCFGLIVFFATTPIPPELLMVLPEDMRTYLIAWTAFCGFVGRYLNQSKGVQSWPLKS